VWAWYYVTLNFIKTAGMGGNEEKSTVIMQVLHAISAQKFWLCINTTLSRKYAESVDERQP
jgi:hypothetical protein